MYRMSYYWCWFSLACNNYFRSPTRWSRNFHLWWRDIQLVGLLLSANPWLCNSTGGKNSLLAFDYHKCFLSMSNSHHSRLFRGRRNFARWSPVSGRKTRCSTALETRLHPNGQRHNRQTIRTRSARFRSRQYRAGVLPVFRMIRTLHWNNISTTQ